MPESDRYASHMEKGQVAGRLPLSEKGKLGSPTTCSGSTLAPSIQHTSGFGKRHPCIHEEFHQFSIKSVTLLQLDGNIRSSPQKQTMAPVPAKRSIPQ